MTLHRLQALSDMFIGPVIERAVRRAAFRGTLGLVGVLCFLLGLVALAAAGFMALNAALSPLEASLVTAGVLFLLGGLFFLVAGRGKDGGRSQPDQFGQPGTEEAPPVAGDPLVNALLAGKVRSEELEELVRKNGKSLALAALVAGVAFGSSPELQRAVADRIRGGSNERKKE